MDFKATKPRPAHCPHGPSEAVNNKAPRSQTAKLWGDERALAPINLIAANRMRRPVLIEIFDEPTLPT